MRDDDGYQTNSVVKILEEIARFTPETGWNLVGLDDFEPPGEMLYMIGHFDTLEDAEAAKARREASGQGDELIIYGPPDRLN